MSDVATSAQVEFEQRIAEVVAVIGDRMPGAELAEHLNAVAGAGTELFEALAEACATGVAEGWLADREGDGIRFGRILRADHAATAGHSVDVVVMDSLAGPYHRHPLGEIDLVLPRDHGAEFDGHDRGWVAYEAESAHYPTVTGGAAIVLYLLPGGQIDFTATPDQ